VEAAPFAYVTNTQSATISVISTVSNPFGVAITPDGKFVYVTNSTSNNVSVISTASNTVVATIPVGDGPEAWPSPLDYSGTTSGNAHESAWNFQRGASATPGRTHNS
jgi:YVTN family beta-propeller protein